MIAFGPPDARRAQARYRRHAAGYDASAQRTMALRARTVALLGLRPGDTVLDVACGTGLSFELLQHGVGEGGRIVAVELCPEMLEVARARVERARWPNVTLICAPAEQARIEARIDALLFNYTHDVLRSPAALANLLATAKPGARIALAGMKLAPWWAVPLNLYALAIARPYMTTFEGLARPWSHLAPRLDDFRWSATHAGIGYIASGRLRAGTAP